MGVKASRPRTPSSFPQEWVWGPVRFLIPLLALAAIAPAKAPPPVAAHPALWKLADADTTIWLFGTIHVLPANYAWRNGPVDKAIGDAQSLTLETVLDTDPGKVATLLTTLGKQAGLPPLAERVPPARRKALADLVKASGLPPTALDGFKTWAAAVMLTGAALRQIGVATTADSGVEPQLTHIFRDAGKPVDGLETPEMQLGFFDALPETGQRALLVATLDDPRKAGTDYRSLLAAWSKGDVARIAKAFADEPEFTPEARELLIRRRDALWADALAKRLGQPGTVFVAVGAGHLTGLDSLQRMLAAKGLTATRVQ